MPDIWGAFNLENSSLKNNQILCNFFFLFLFFPKSLFSSICFVLSWQYPSLPSPHIIIILSLNEIANYYLIFFLKLSPFSYSNLHCSYCFHCWNGRIEDRFWWVFRLFALCWTAASNDVSAYLPFLMALIVEMNS